MIRATIIIAVIITAPAAEAKAIAERDYERR